MKQDKTNTAQPKPSQLRCPLCSILTDSLTELCLLGTTLLVCEHCYEKIIDEQTEQHPYSKRYQRLIKVRDSINRETA